MIKLRILDNELNEFYFKEVNDNEVIYCEKHGEPTIKLENYILYNGLIWNATYNPNMNHFTIRDYFKPIKKCNKPIKQTYIELSVYDNVTEKAYGIIVGSNNHVGNTFKVYYEWIAISQCKEVNGKIFVPVWIAKQFNTNNFNYNNKIIL